MNIQGDPTNPGRSGLFARVIQNTVVLLSGRVTGIVLGGASSVLFARYLGSEKLGQFSALYAYASLFAWLANLGIEPILTREAARRRDLASSIVVTGMALCATTAILTTALVVWAAPLAGYPGQMQLLVLFASMELLVFGPLRLPGIIFQVDLRQWFGVLINLTRQVLWLGIILFLAHTHASLPAFVIGRLAVATLETLLILFISAPYLKPPRTILLSQLKPYLRACIPISFSALLASVYLRIDQVMLHSMTTDNILGEYAAAVKISELFEMLPAALLASLFPILATAAADEFRIREYTDRVFRYMMVAVGGLCVAVSTGSSLIIGILYGSQFSSAGHLLRILVWSEFAVFYGSVVANVLLARNLQAYLVYPAVVGATVNVLLNLLLIPRYAAGGSAVATVASYTAAWMLVLLGFGATRQIIVAGLRHAVPVFLLSGMVTLGVSRLLTSPIFQVAAALGLYLVGIVCIRALSMEDVRYVRAALTRDLRRLHQPGDVPPEVKGKG